MANFIELQNEIAGDLRRSNLTTEIKKAVLDAIADHDSERFWFNELVTYTLVVTADDTPLAPQPPIQEFIMLDTVRAQQGGTTGSWYTVIQAEDGPTDIERLRSNPSVGQPARWAMLGNTLQIWPTPNKGYNLRLFGHYRLTPLVADGDSNYWTTTARNLIRYTAVKRLFAFPIRDVTQMQLAKDAGMTELEYLRRETERRNRGGRMKAYG